MNLFVKLIFSAHLALTAATASQPLQAQDTPKVEVINYGVFTSEPVRQDPKKVRDEVKGEKLVSQTATIVAKLGTEFGFTYRIIGAPKDKPIELRVVTKFPPKGIKDEQNDTVFESETKVSVDGSGPFYEGFKFESKGELVAGEWVISLYLGETKLTERKFNVVLK